MPRIAYLGPEGTFTEAALHRMTAGGRSLTRRRRAIHSGPHRKHRGAPRRDPVPGRRLRLRADRELDRRIDTAHAGQPGHRDAAAGLRRTDARRGVQHRGPAGDTGRRRRDGRRVPGRAAQVRHWLAAQLPTARDRAGQFQCRGRTGRRRRPGRRGGEHRAGRASATDWPRWPRASSTSPTRAPDSFWSDRPGRHLTALAPTAPRWCCASITCQGRWYRR